MKKSTPTLPASKSLPDRRLSAVLDFVPRCAALCDVGSDHGYVPLALFREGLIARAILTDIHKGPLARAQAVLQEHNLAHRARFVLCDGLCAVSGDAYDCAVIAGMGGMTIAHILANAEGLTPAHTLVLQPMTQAAQLRQWLFANGFSIEKTRAVRRQHRAQYYLVFKVKKTHEQGRALSFAEAFAGDDLEDTAEALGYLVWEKNRTLSIIKAKKSAKNADDAAISQYEAVLERLEGMIVCRQRTSLQGCAT